MIGWIVLAIVALLILLTYCLRVGVMAGYDGENGWATAYVGPKKIALYPRPAPKKQKPKKRKEGAKPARPKPSPKELLAWLKGNRPNQQLVFTHGDYCLPNLFVKGERISGFIDLGRSGLADPYQDIALCYRSLLHNLTQAGQDWHRYVSLFFQELELTPDWEKIRYYILLDELF